MDRADAAGLGASVAGHAALLTLMWFLVSTAGRVPVVSAPMDVSYVDEAGAVSSSPNPTPSAAPPSAAEPGPVEQAAPAPQASPAPVPAAVPAPARQQLRPQPAPQGGRGSGETNRTPGLTDLNPASFGSDRQRPAGTPGAMMSPQALASIVALIQRQIQPCASRRSNLLGDGAERIRVTLNLRLRPDGTLAATPTLLPARTIGVDDENRRYVQQVGDLIRAAVRECAPIRGLPAELYNTPRGGWSNINVNFKFPDR